MEVVVVGTRHKNGDGVRVECLRGVAPETLEGLIYRIAYKQNRKKEREEKKLFFIILRVV